MPYMRSTSGKVFHTNHPEYHKDCENLGSGPKAKAARMEYARQQLRAFIKPGDTVYYDVKRVSSSGMSRAISFYVAAARDDGRAYIRCIDGLMSDACGISESRAGGLTFHGCGMNMGFSGVYNLGRALYPEGFGTIGENAKGKKVRATSHAHAKRLQALGYVFRGRNGDASGWDHDGGYALGYSSL